jgi:lauroyl/myristoyl acyltransferase
MRIFAIAKVPWMSIVPDSPNEMEDGADRGVAFASQPVDQVRMPALARQDLYAVLSLLSLAPLALCVADRHWPSVCHGFAHLALAGRSARWRKKKILAGLRIAFPDQESVGDEPFNSVCTILEASRLELRAQILRDLLRQDWRPDIRIEGTPHIEAALAAGHGAILWISRFAFADTVAKIGLRRAGYPPTHLSRTIHGFSHSRFGRQCLNPIQQRMEDRYLAERVILSDSAPAGAMRRLHKVLLQNGVVSITVDSWGAHAAEVPFFDGRLGVATGAPSLAWKTGARLLPVFVVRQLRSGTFRLLIDDPLPIERATSKSEAQQIAIARYASRLESHAAAFPGQWRDWPKLRPRSS